MWLFLTNNNASLRAAARLLQGKMGTTTSTVDVSFSYQGAGMQQVCRTGWYIPSLASNVTQLIRTNMLEPEPEPRHKAETGQTTELYHCYHSSNLHPSKVLRCTTSSHDQDRSPLSRPGALRSAHGAGYWAGDCRAHSSD